LERLSDVRFNGKVEILRRRLLRVLDWKRDDDKSREVRLGNLQKKRGRKTIVGRYQNLSENRTRLVIERKRFETMERDFK
jgi:hypothetical protein